MASLRPTRFQWSFDLFSSLSRSRSLKSLLPFTMVFKCGAEISFTIFASAISMKLPLHKMCNRNLSTSRSSESVVTATTTPFGISSAMVGPEIEC